MSTHTRFIVSLEPPSRAPHFTMRGGVASVAAPAFASHRHRASNPCRTSRHHRSQHVAMAHVDSAPSWKDLASRHTAETSSAVRRLTEDAAARARGGGPPHQDNKLRLFGANESDVRVTLYRDHAGVSVLDLARPRVDISINGRRRTTDNRVLGSQTYRSGARTAKSCGSCSRKSRFRIAWRR